MNNKIFLLLGIFALVFIPSSVYADTSGQYLITKVDKLYYNINDLTDTYDVNNTTLNNITTSSSLFYHFYRFYVGTTLNIVDSNTNVSKYYSPGFFKLYNGSNAINLCTEQCDQMFSFTYYFQGIVSNASNYENEYALATTYLNRARDVSTSFSGIKIVGTDVNDDPKEFYCTGQYVLNNLGQTDPYYRFFATCPTSNFKHVDYILIDTGWPAIQNTTFQNMAFYIDRFNYVNSAYTGTQDGLGGSTSSNDNSTEEEILNELNNLIDMDLDNSDKTLSNTSDYNDYQDAEQDLFYQMNNADIDDMEIAIDVNSSTWVWDRITSWLATNPLLSSFLISMLSIGIIKMALGR